MNKVQHRAGNVIYAAALAVPLSVIVYQGRAMDAQPADRDVIAFVQERVRDWQPTAAERRFDEIGWAKDIREAERLAKLHGRPVFLFTHDGRMAIGRC
jgi:hypothetical protein